MVVRVNKNSNYTVMSNHHLMNRNLSLKAKGLLSVVLSLPDNWEYSVAGLASISKEKESAITSALKELKESGYLIVTKKMPNMTKSGRIEYEWDFYEMPQNQKQETEKQGIENLGLEVQGLENQGQLNTNKPNTNISNTNGNIFETSYDFVMKHSSSKRFVPPTFEEVSEYCQERGNSVDPQRFIDFYTSKNWYVGKTKMVDWKASVRTWERNEKERTVQKPKKSSGNEFIDLLQKWEEEDE